MLSMSVIAMPNSRSKSLFSLFFFPLNLVFTVGIAATTTAFLAAAVTYRIGKQVSQKLAEKRPTKHTRGM